MDRVTEWIVKVGDWEYDAEKPKRKWNDCDKIAHMLISDFKVPTDCIEAYTELTTFAYVYDMEMSDSNKPAFPIDINNFKKYIKLNGGINNIIETYRNKNIKRG